MLGPSKPHGKEEDTVLDPEELILLAADTARLVLESGGETYRAEDAAMDIISSQGGVEAECFATSTGVILSFSGPDGRVRSVVRRVKRRAMNLEKVARIDGIVEELRADAIDIDTAALRFGEAERIAGRSATAAMGAAAVGTGFFALLFGGGWREALAAAAAGAFLSALSRVMTRHRLPDFVINLCGGMLAALACLCARELGLIDDVDKAIIGVIMLLVPGVAITNAIRDTIAGDLVAGLARAADAFLAAAALSAGTGGAFGLWRLFGGSF